MQSANASGSVQVTTPDAMVLREDTVLDASLAFLDEIDVLPELSHGGTGVGRALEEAEKKLDEALVRNDANGALACFTGLTAANGTTIDEQKKAKPAPKNASTRQKQELAYLRTQVQELEAELAQLQQHRSPPSTNMALWEDIAKRQRNAKTRAEVENTKLWEQLQGQLKVARSLEKLMCKRQNDMLPELGNTKRPRIIEICESSDAIYQSIRASLDARTIVADEWIKESGLDRIQDNHHDAQVRSGADNEIYLEVLMCQHYPFPLEATAEAVWKCISRRQVPLGNGTYAGLGHSDDHCYSRANLNLNFRRLNLSMDVYGVGKRFIEKDRVVVVMECRTVAKCSSFKGKRECLDDLGYVVIERDPTRSGPSTLVKSCIRSWPKVDEMDGPQVHRPNFELLVDMMIGSFNDNCQHMLQFIENTLLEESLATH
ncbi:hypothetical protein Poli38472_004845 [Pythium oligandrum]|uniref:M96 mating-specific protein family n=1 Tax=Pythium oligandrum TaxID=41045 RepID=A0A8K1FET1_PYTOL|nr:hypothetical protein Poli38472_004845 [Pythium oligandrum]|eukprot:TMW59776.1 hypothetical protein Poli38472_004845 [Pythium oligandrum]